MLLHYSEQSTNLKQNVLRVLAMETVGLDRKCKQLRLVSVNGKSVKAKAGSLLDVGWIVRRRQKWAEGTMRYD